MPSLVMVILRACVTFWFANQSMISSIDTPARSGRLMIPRDVFKDMCGLHWAGIEKNCFSLRSDSTCPLLVISTRRAPDFNFWQDFGDVAILEMHFSITTGDNFERGRSESVDSIIKNRWKTVAFPFSFSESESSWARFLFFVFGVHVCR